VFQKLPSTDLNCAGLTNTSLPILRQPHLGHDSSTTSHTSWREPQTNHSTPRSVNGPPDSAAYADGKCSPEGIRIRSTSGSPHVPAIGTGPVPPMESIILYPRMVAIVNATINVPFTSAAHVTLSTTANTSHLLLLLYGLRCEYASICLRNCKVHSVIAWGCAFIGLCLINPDQPPQHTAAHASLPHYPMLAHARLRSLPACAAAAFHARPHREPALHWEKAAALPHVKKRTCGSPAERAQ